MKGCLYYQQNWCASVLRFDCANCFPSVMGLCSHRNVNWKSKRRISVAGVLKEVVTHFAVDTRAHYKSGSSNVKVHISNPSGSNTDTQITDIGDGTYRVEYTPYEDGEAQGVTSMFPTECSCSLRSSEFITMRHKPLFKIWLFLYNSGESISGKFSLCVFCTFRHQFKRKSYFFFFFHVWRLILVF